MIWQIYAGFHSSSHYSSNAEKNKTQIWLCAQKNCGRLQLVWFIISFFPFPKIALLDHKKSARSFVSHFWEGSVLEPRVRPKMSEKSHIPPYWCVKILSPVKVINHDPQTQGCGSLSVLVVCCLREMEWCAAQAVSTSTWSVQWSHIPTCPSLGFTATTWFLLVLRL